MKSCQILFLLLVSCVVLAESSLPETSPSLDVLVSSSQVSSSTSIIPSSTPPRITSPSSFVEALSAAHLRTSAIGALPTISTFEPTKVTNLLPESHVLSSLGLSRSRFSGSPSSTPAGSTTFAFVPTYTSAPSQTFSQEPQGYPSLVPPPGKPSKTTTTIVYSVLGVLGGVFALGGLGLCFVATRSAWLARFRSRLGLFHPGDYTCNSVDTLVGHDGQDKLRELGIWDGDFVSRCPPNQMR